MDFCFQLSPIANSHEYTADKVCNEMVEQAVHAEKLGVESVSITEHHMLNILMMPAPLQLAVKIAALTKQLNIITSIVVLPLHDMRTYAGDVAIADALCEGRLLLGVGRGAFKYEMERLGVTMEETQAKFNESLDVLKALLSEKEVSWDGEYYKFEPMTLMPRPVQAGGPGMMMAVLNPEGIYHCTKRGFHIQTTPLSGHHQLLLDQVDAFNRAKEEMGARGAHLTLSLSRVGFPTKSESDRQRKLDLAYEYYSRFDNVFTGPGIVEEGIIKPLPRKQTRDEMDASLMICSPQEMIDRLGVYQDLGIDRVIVNSNFGAEQQEILDTMQLFAEDVMPSFQNIETDVKKAV
ncbi:LLM class flavin-dependent oxidoreductase [Curvivirga sp.]|uniref:LLM class flavin-dependent oxidoreductase n=1 Tax=Curvivirga sp. TaxID=2856848 RepID=UPI003B5A2E18